MYVNYNKTIDAETEVGCDLRASNYQVTTTSAGVTVKIIPVEGATPVWLGDISVGRGASFSIKGYALVLIPSASTEITVVGY